MCAVIHYLIFFYKKNKYFYHFFHKIFSKSHHLKKIIGGACPQTPLANARQSAMQITPRFQKYFDPPPRNEILDTPLLVIDMCGARSENYYWKWLDRREEVSVGFGRGGGPLLWHVLYELIFVSGVSFPDEWQGVRCPNFSKGVYLPMAVKVTEG